MLEEILQLLLIILSPEHHLEYQNFLLSAHFFSKSTFSKISFRNTISHSFLVMLNGWNMKIHSHACEIFLLHDYVTALGFV